ncbi:MAG: response regulator [Desulfobacteraceae bacterium]|nr:MAG: response regulator [Desulfobacteraceae bacterium]
MFNRHEVLITAINRIFLEALTCETEEQLGRICLSVAEQATKSRFGFLGKVDETGKLEDLAVSNPEQDPCRMAGRRQCRSQAQAGQLHDLYSRGLKEAFFTNQPNAHPDNVPAGHPQLHAFMGVPLSSNDGVIGMVAVGNRDGGYSGEDLQVLKDLAGAIVQALVHKRTEQALANELANNKRLQEISARLIPEGDVDVLLTEILKAALDFLNADMGSIHLYDSLASQLRIIAQHGLKLSYLKFFERGKADTCCVCGTALESGQRTVVPDVNTSEIFADNPPSLAVLLKAGVRAVQSTPLVSRSGQILGLISTHWRQPHEPGQRELRLLDTLARQAADAIERQQTQVALLQSHERLEQRVVERTLELQIRARQLQRLALELSQAEEREHERIAEILHDDLQQYLSALKFRLWDLLPEERMDLELKQKVADLEGLIHESIQKIRRLSHELSPPVLKQNGLVAALNWLSREIQEKHGLNVTLSTQGEVNPDSATIASVLYRAVRELLFNVIKHAGTASAAVEAVRDGKWIRISVTDQGKGFDPENCVIEKNDAGFGLFSLRERISYLGGGLVIKSALGKGCRVELTVETSVPLKLPSGISTTQRMPLAVPPGLQAQKTGQGKIRILLVDDHTIMREGLANLFKGKEGFEVVAQAANGRQAVQLAAEVRPDIILMDVSMPVMDGIEATAQISRLQTGTRIIGLSMHDDDETREKMLSAGASAYIYKAAPAGELIAAIKQVISG